MFVAVELSDLMKDALCDVINYLRSQNISGSFTHRDNLHLTLVFIGESDRTDDAVKAINSVVANRFELKLEKTGFFGDLLWVETEKSRSLEKLADNLADALRKFGFDIENRPFVPHITIVRKVQNCAKDLPIKTENAMMLVNHISLMRSDRINGKLTYSRVYSRKI